MSTENESRQEGAANEENQNVSRDGGYKSYNRDSNYNRYNNDGEQRQRFDLIRQIFRTCPRQRQAIVS